MSDEARMTIDPLFTFHRLNPSGVEKAIKIAEVFTDLKNRLSGLCPENTREFAIVKTKLEEASFFAKKAMAGDVVNQESLNG